MPSIKSTKALYTKVVDYEDMLLDTWRWRSSASEGITTDNLIPTLKRLGWEQLNYQGSRPNQSQLSQDRRVLLTIAEDDGNTTKQEDSLALTNQTKETHDDMLQEVYQVMQCQQQAPPPGGYMFSHNDHVTTQMGRLPPYPCQCCRSENHWDKECPDYDIHRVWTSGKKDAHSTEKEIDEDDKLYQSAYGILLSQCIAASQIDLNHLQSDFKSAVHKEEASAFSAGRIGSGHKTRGRYKTTVEEVDDESDIAAHTKMKSTTHILIHESKAHEDQRPQMSKHPPSVDNRSHRTPARDMEEQCSTEHHTQSKPSVHASPNETIETKQDMHLPPPPKELKLIRMNKKRFYPAGESSVGVSVLSVKGWVGNLNNTKMDLHLDSCASITLISSEYYDSLREAPAIQQGMRMKLWQLTDKDSTL